MNPLSSKRFDELVSEAIDSVGEPFGELMSNVVIVVDDEDSDDPGLLGLYEGIPLTEREEYGGGMELPDRITIYRLPICDMCDTDAEVRKEVQITVVHEIAHHFGIDDDRLHELGWA